MAKKVLIVSVLVIVILLGFASAASQYAYKYSQVSSFALFPGTDSHLLEVFVDKDQVECVALGRSVQDTAKGIMIDGELCLKMYDDGTNGDKVANDGTYSVLLAPGYFEVDNNRGYLNYGIREIFIVHKGANYDSRQGYSGNLVERQNNGTGYAIVSPELKGQVSLNKVAENIYATDYAVFIVDTDHKLLPGFPMVDAQCFDMDFIIGASKLLYSVYPDNFDFITVMPGGTMVDPTRPTSWGGYAENVPFFKSVRQDIRGIGLDTWDFTATYGSGGRLQGAIYHSFGDASILLHEVGHQWGIHYGYDLGLSTDGNHWVKGIAPNDYDVMSEFLFIGDSAYRFRYHDGQLEAVLNFDQRDQLRPGFSDLTLYLMGLLPPEEVDPIRLLTDVKVTDGKVSASEQVITIEDLITLEGPRQPGCQDAQKDFNMAFVMITQDVPTPAEAAFVTLMAKYFGSKGPKEGDIVPFYTATGGRGTMNTKLPKVTGQLVTTGSWSSVSKPTTPANPPANPSTPPSTQPPSNPPSDPEPDQDPPSTGQNPVDTPSDDDEGGGTEQPVLNPPADTPTKAKAFPWLPVLAGAGVVATGGIILLLVMKAKK